MLPMSPFVLWKTLGGFYQVREDHICFTHLIQVNDTPYVVSHVDFQCASPDALGVKDLVSDEHMPSDSQADLQEEGEEGI